MISIKNLSFRYQKRKPLFDELSLDLNANSIIGLLGKNGAGKSTLLGLIAGLISTKGGDIKVNEYTPFDRKPDFLADTYLVSEEFSFPNISIRQYSKAFAPFYPKFDLNKLDQILTEFQLEQDNQLNKLSHGQRKKFLIAFALSTNCQLLLLDEPTNGLDIPSKSQFRKILVSSITEEQLVIISTHQVKDIDSIIDTIIVMDEGKIVFDYSIDQIIQTYHFDISETQREDSKVLYQEKCPMGYKSIRNATNEADTIVDIELLFNAIINKSIK